MNEKKRTLISASPKVRKFAREIGADLHLIEGSQRDGRVNEDDIKSFVKKSLSGKILNNNEKSIEGYDHSEFGDIEKKIVELSTKAKEGSLTMEDLTGGTFTISNGGVYGSMLSTPIINRPQSGILGMHNIQKRAVVVDDEIVIRPMMYLAFSYDHRIIDGKESVGFLVSIKNLLENPSKLILGV